MEGVINKAECCNSSLSLSSLQSYVESSSLPIKCEYSKSPATMKLILALCVTVATASYNSATTEYPPQEYPTPYGAQYGQQSYGKPEPYPKPYPAPYSAPYGQQSYGKPEPYPKPYYYPKLKDDGYYSSSSRDYYNCRWKDYSDESHAPRSKRCSRCRPLKVNEVALTPPARVRYNTLANGCTQAVISFPKAGGLFAIRSVSKTNPKNTTLAIGMGGQLVAQCRHDRLFHTSSLTSSDVTIRSIDCVKVLLERPINSHRNERSATIPSDVSNIENDSFDDDIEDFLS